MRRDTEFAGKPRVRGNRNKLIARRALCRKLQPLAHHFRVGQSFDRGKRFRLDDCERAGGIEAGQRALHGGGIDIGNVMHARAVAGIGRQRLRRQRRAQVRAADPDVDYIGEFAAAAAGNRAVAHAVGEFAHASERGLDLRHDIHAVDHHRHRVAQRRVQHRAILAYVDFFAVEQALDFVAEAALARERDSNCIVSALTRFLE